MGTYRVKTRHLIIAILGLMSFVSTLNNIRYIKMHMPSINYFCLFTMLIALTGGFLFCIKNMKENSSKIQILIFYFMYLFATTVLHRGSLSIYVLTIGPAICLFFLIVGIRNDEEMSVLLDTLCKCCFVLLCFDLISMVTHPNGLYKGASTYYDINWFLGFKTERFYYTLPLVVMSTYQYFVRGMLKKDRNKLIVICALVLLSSLKSQATAATIAMALYMICLPFIGLFNVEKDNFFTRTVKKFINLISNFYVFMVAYIFVFFTVVAAQTSSGLINFIANVTGKSLTLSGRTLIWLRVLNYIKEHVLSGVGMIDTESYQKITLGYNNPHNIVLSFLMTGGFIGFALIVIAIFMNFRSVKEDKNRISLVFATIVFLILGITSSALAFCPFFFAIIAISLKGHKKIKEKPDYVLDGLIEENNNDASEDNGEDETEEVGDGEDDETGEDEIGDEDETGDEEIEGAVADVVFEDEDNMEEEPVIPVEEEIPEENEIPEAEEQKNPEDNVGFDFEFPGTTREDSSSYFNTTNDNDEGASDK